jgi:Ni,Fe-hydrogenase III large subunit/Ni,Fe-hydrogenase III component G
MISVEEVRAGDLQTVAAAAYDNGQNALLAMFANDEREINGHFAIYCVFSRQDPPYFRIIKGILHRGEALQFPSLVPVISAAAWYEREIHDLFGLTPLGHPDLRPLVLHENWPHDRYPLRKDFAANTSVPVAKENYRMEHVQGEGVFEVPVGPIHAGIIEPGHFRFSQAGENTINLDAKLFFTPRGIEKAVEGLTLSQAFYLIERTCGACTVSHALSYSQAIEGIAGVDVPLRAQYVRVVAAELERLYNHVGDIGNLCAGLGFAAGSSNGARLKEALLRLNELVAGNRFLRGLVTPGGVAMDITSEIASEIVLMMQVLDSDFKEVLDLLRENDAFSDRINRTGILTKQAASDLGVVGVAARASGISTDMRRDVPYAVYNDMQFKVPVYTSGDVAARLWVRVDEIAQSVRIIRQALKNLPDGPLTVEIPAIKPFSSGLGWSESPRGSNLHWVMVGSQNTIYRCFIRSASYANWPAVAVAVPGNIIPDFPLINKSFELCYACIDR